MCLTSNTVLSLNWKLCSPEQTQSLILHHASHCSALKFGIACHWILIVVRLVFLIKEPSWLHCFDPLPYLSKYLPSKICTCPVVFHQICCTVKHGPLFSPVLQQFLHYSRSTHSAGECFHVHSFHSQGICVLKAKKETKTRECVCECVTTYTGLWSLTLYKAQVVFWGGSRILWRGVRICGHDKLGVSGGMLPRKNLNLIMSEMPCPGFQGEFEGKGGFDWTHRTPLNLCSVLPVSVTKGWVGDREGGGGKGGGEGGGVGGGRDWEDRERRTLNIGPPAVWYSAQGIWETLDGKCPISSSKQSLFQWVGLNNTWCLYT